MTAFHHGVISPVELAQRLIRFDTTNPPGREAACVRYLDELLREAGLQTRIIARDPERLNLVVRLPGQGRAPALLMHGHVDVVPAQGQGWSHPPFDGELREGDVWGRGALDMKGAVAAMTTALLRLQSARTAPAGDVLLAIVADEEAGSRFGARFLVEEHAGLFDGVSYAIGEDGGASLQLDGRVRLHPIVVAEKRAAWLRVTIPGPAGHASRITGPDAAFRRLHRLLSVLERGGLGPVTTPVGSRMLTELAAAHPGRIAEQLLAFRDRPGDADALAGVGERDALYLRSISQHTLNPTVIRGGTRTNVVPSAITVELDGRLLPGGFGTADLIAALRAMVDFPLDVEVLVEGEMIPEPTFGPFYKRLAAVLKAADPDGLPVPMVTTASTDARLFPQLGIDSYGWMPLLLPAGSTYRDLLHGPDERVPAEALHFAADCYEQLLLSYP